MPDTMHATTLRRLTELTRRFVDFRARELRPRGRRNFIDVLDLVEEYLGERGIEAVDLAVGASAKVRRGVTSVATVVSLLDDFEDAYLIDTIGADREFLRISEHVVRDFTRWLRGRRLGRLVA